MTRKAALFIAILTAACSNPEDVVPNDAEGRASPSMTEPSSVELQSAGAYAMEPLSAAHTGDPDRELPPPRLELRDEAATERIMAAIAAEAAQQTSPSAWINRFKARASGPTSLVLVELVSDDGPSDEGRLSTWNVHAVLAGAPTPSTIELLQYSPDGEFAEDIMARGAKGRVDGMIVQRVGSYYRLIADEMGNISYFSGRDDAVYNWHLGPSISHEELLVAVEKWQ